MQHNVAKNVLHVKHGLDAIARKAVISAEEAHSLLESAKRKLYAARLRRPTPFVDKTIYVAWNAMCISAYLAAGRVLDAPAAKAFALKSLDRVLAEARNARGDLAHVAAYGEPEEAGSSASLHPASKDRSPGTPGYGMTNKRWRVCWTTTCSWGTRRWMRGRRLASCTTTRRQKI